MNLSELRCGLGAGVAYGKLHSSILIMLDTLLLDRTLVALPKKWRCNIQKRHEEIRREFGCDERDPQTSRRARFDLNILQSTSLYYSFFTMSVTVNGFFVIATQLLDVFLSVMGVVICTFGIYLAPGLATDSTLNQWYFATLSTISVCTFVLIIISVALSCMGIRWQKLNPSPDDEYPWLTGKRVLIARNFLAAVLVGLSVWTLFNFYSLDVSFRNTKNQINAGNDPSYDAFERDFSGDFNAQYFKAVNNCKENHWIWDRVEKYCGYSDLDDDTVSIYEDQCEADCGNTSGTCRTSEDACDDNQKDCPYHICRKGLLTFMEDRLMWAYYVCSVTALLAILQWCCTLALMCYHHKASFVEVLEKMGAIRKHGKVARGLVETKSFGLAPKGEIKLFWTSHEHHSPEHAARKQKILRDDSRRLATHLNFH